MKWQPVLFQQRLPGLTLQGCKTKYFLLVSLQYKLYRTVTKIAYSIKENDGVPPLPPKGGSEARVSIYGSAHYLRMGRNFRLYPATMSVPPPWGEGGGFPTPTSSPGSPRISSAFAGSLRQLLHLRCGDRSSG